MSTKKPHTNPKPSSSTKASKATSASAYSRTASSGRAVSRKAKKVTITTSPLTGLPVIHGKVTITEGGRTKRVRDLHARVR